MESLTSHSAALDLAIIGGGPAGTAAALEAGHFGLRAAIWERDRYPRDRVCGEFISSEALPFLQTEIPGTVAHGTEIRYAEFVSRNGLSRTFRLPRPALGLSRRVMDAALWKACGAAGVEVHEGEAVRSVRKVSSGEQRPAAWQIETADGNIRKARTLIVACGRWWAVEGLSSPARRSGTQTPGEWVGVKAHFAGIRPRGNVEMYFFRGGYCGLAPVEDGASNACCLVHRERIRECGAKRMGDFVGWLVEVSRLAALEKRLRGAQRVSAVVTTAPVSLSRRRAAQGEALIVGDSSGFLDPFTGEGISKALYSGRLAARAVASSEGFSNESAAEIYCQSLKEAGRRSYMIAGMARGLLHGPEWLRELVTAQLPWIGEYVVRQTRWHRSQGANLA